MKVLKKGIMPNGTNIQIEEWNQNYSFMPYGNTIASYPKSKVTHAGTYSPKGNETYRFSFEFESYEDATEVFESLENGTIQLADLKENYSGKIEYLNCL